MTLAPLDRHAPGRGSLGDHSILRSGEMTGVRFVFLESVPRALAPLDVASEFDAIAAKVLAAGIAFDPPARVRGGDIDALEDASSRRPEILHLSAHAGESELAPVDDDAPATVI